MPWTTWKPTATRSAPGRSAFHDAVPCGRRRETQSHSPAMGTIITANTSSCVAYVASRYHQVSEIAVMNTRTDAVARATALGLLARVESHG